MCCKRLVNRGSNILERDSLIQIFAVVLIASLKCWVIKNSVLNVHLDVQMCMYESFMTAVDD